MSRITVTRLAEMQAKVMELSAAISRTCGQMCDEAADWANCSWDSSVSEPGGQALQAIRETEVSVLEYLNQLASKLDDIRVRVTVQGQSS